jgi:hypothetical protein
MKTDRENGMGDLLRHTLPPVKAGTEPARDLWPLVLQRLDARPAAPPWFDWALFAGLVALGASFPAAVPVILYYL